ncbi:MAG: methionine adenosyltransferase [Deltaproteobacteria bacterium]|nr:methionine adenosyltransferase [Deltaproteobacteria bacterium]
MKKEFVHTSESVTEGHPDKLCDQISDALVDRFFESDPKSRVSAECAVSSSIVFIAARFASAAKVDFPNVARKVIRKIGYTDREFNFKTCNIITSLKEIALDQTLLFEESTIADDDIDKIPATDQVTLFGFACRQSSELMPLPITLAHKLARRLTSVRRDAKLPYLAPDGSTQVGVHYKDGKPFRIHSLTISATQLDRFVPTPSTLRDDILTHVVDEVFKDEPVRPDNDTRLFINPYGFLKLGGPSVHSGLTGRKNALDTYGGYSRNSGSALSGKDPLRIDRVAAYAARYAAKNVVAAGLAEECEVELSYAIGLAQPVSIQIETRGTGIIDDNLIAQKVERCFDFRLGGIIKKFNLRLLPSLSKGGFFRKLAVFGHFGRKDLSLPWEETDKIDELLVV